VRRAQEPSVTLEERDQSHRRRSDNRRRAAAGGDQRDLSERIARAEDSDERSVPSNLGRARLDRAQRVPEVALRREHLTLVRLDLGRNSGDRRKLGLGEAGEERNGTEPGGVEHCDNVTAPPVTVRQRGGVRTVICDYGTRPSNPGGPN
jgi:hypothetical protein